MGKNSRLGVLVGKTKTDEGCHLINEGVCVYEFVSVCSSTSVYMTAEVGLRDITAHPLLEVEGQGW